MRSPRRSRRRLGVREDEASPPDSPRSRRGSPGPQAHPLELTIEGLYLTKIPKAKTPNYHADSSAVRLGLAQGDADDAGGWLYVFDPKAEDFGALYVNCTHTDSKGSAWTSY